jgi:hypothetical protein
VFFHSTKPLFADIFWPADWKEFFKKDYTVWLDAKHQSHPPTWGHLQCSHASYPTPKVCLQELKISNSEMSIKK